MDLNRVLSAVRKKFSPGKMVDFNEEGFHFMIEPLCSTDESKVLTALKDVEDTQYIESLKRQTLACAIKRIKIDADGEEAACEIDLTVDDIEYEEKGEKKIKSKYLYMMEFFGKFPSALVDELFEAFSNMNMEVQARVKTGVKYERFILSETVPEEKTSKFKRTKDTVPAEELSQEERLAKKVEKEIEQANAKISEAVPQ
jgi:hypothetical protein